MKPQQLIDEVLQSGRSFLLEPEAYELCDFFGIPHPATVFVPSGEDPAKAAAGLSYPVVAKIVSPAILHKSDVGGVVPGIQSVEELADAVAKLLANVKKNAPDAPIKGILLQQMAAKGGVEVVIGGLRNNAFGPVIMFGLGGILVEVFKDVSFRLAPLDADEALRMIMETKASQILQGVRGAAPCDLGALSDLLVKVSHMLADVPQIKELDLNPVFAYADGCFAVDARVIL